MIHWKDQDLIIAVYVQPNARQDKIVGTFHAHIKIQITAPAIENKANRYLQKWLAKQFRVGQTSVELLKGEQSRYKIFCIHDPKQLPAWVDAYLDNALPKRGDF